MTTTTNGGPAAEIATMKRLTQQGAAWMLGLTPRSLRDNVALERNPDGSYDARQVVEFARQSGRLPTLDDHQYEAALLIADKLPTEYIARIVPAVKTLVAEIGGDTVAALAAVALVLWTDKTETLGMFPEQFDFGPKRFNVVHVCDCGKFRRGRRWIKADPPEGQPTIGAICPNCQRNFGRVRTPVEDLDEDLDECDLETVPVRKGRK